MKLQYKIGMLAVGALALCSCDRHDIINDIAPVGQEVPACYWQLNSTVCKAGESFGFQGKYSVNPAATPDRSEVWYQIVRTEEASVTSKLGGSSLAYTHKSSKVDTIRSYQSVAVFPHSAAQQNGQEFVINGTVPVSRTLAPVKWADISQWDQANFDTYYPEGFAEGFLSTVIGYLTDEATADSYYNALRNIYISYGFSNAQFTALGFPEVDQEQPEASKSDLWFSTTEASDDALVGYYYFEVVDGKNVAREISIADKDKYNDRPIYPVYKSAEWVFCRYDDNAGGILATVRPEWLPKFRSLLEQIPFQDWIYDNANSCYKVEFTRNYSLNAQFRVYDTAGNEGRAYDIHTISIN